MTENLVSNVYRVTQQHHLDGERWQYFWLSYPLIYKEPPTYPHPDNIDNPVGIAHTNQMEGTHYTILCQLAGSRVPKLMRYKLSITHFMSVLLSAELFALEITATINGT